MAEALLDHGFDILSPEEEAECTAILADMKAHPERGVRATAHPGGTISFYLPDGSAETI